MEASADAQGRLAALTGLLQERNVDGRAQMLLLDFARTNTVEPSTTEAAKLPLSAASDAYAAVWVHPTLANLQLLAEPAAICMGAIDTSGYGGGPADWLRDFREIQARIDRAGDGSEVEPRFSYWHVATRDLRVAFEPTTSDAWSMTGRGGPSPPRTTTWDEACRDCWQPSST